jgi:hypothetical protein
VDAPDDASGNPKPEPHNIRLSERADHKLFGRPVRSRPECDCGWVGDWHATGVGARAEGNQHQALAQRGWSALRRRPRRSSEVTESINSQTSFSSGHVA